MPKFIVYCLHDVRGRTTLGYVQAASEPAALSKARRQWELDERTERFDVEAVQPRRDCRCPECGWTYKGGRLSGFAHVDGPDVVEERSCRLCRAKRDMEHKARIFLKQKAEVARLEQLREAERERRRARVQAARAKLARRRPTLAELRRENERDG